MHSALLGDDFRHFEAATATTIVGLRGIDIGAASDGFMVMLSTRFGRPRMASDWALMSCGSRVAQTARAMQIHREKVEEVVILGRGYADMGG